MSKTDLNNIVQNISLSEDSNNLLNSSDISDSDNANWNPYTDGTAEKYANELGIVLDNDSNIWDNISENKNTKQKSKKETVNKLNKINVVSNNKQSAANVLDNKKMENKTNKNRDFNIFDENDIINKFFYVNGINTKKIKTKDKSSFINNIGNYINYCNNKCSFYEVLFKNQFVKLYFDIDKVIDEEQLETFINIAKHYNSSVSISGYITDKNIYYKITDTLAALSNNYDKLKYFINYKEPNSIINKIQYRDKDTGEYVVKDNNKQINTISLHIVYYDTCFDYSTFCKKKQKIIMKDKYKNIQNVIDHSVYNDGRLFRHICCDKIIYINYLCGKNKGDNKGVKLDENNTKANISIDELYKQQIIQRLDITDKNKVVLNNISDIMDIINTDKNIIPKAANVNKDNSRKQNNSISPADYNVRKYIKELLTEFCYDTTNKGLYKTLTNVIPYNELSMYGTNHFMEIYKEIYNSRNHKTIDNIDEIFNKLSACHYRTTNTNNIDNKSRGLMYCLTYLKTLIVNKYYDDKDKAQRKLFKKSLLFYCDNKLIQTVRTIAAEDNNNNNNIEKSAYDYCEELAANVDNDYYDLSHNDEKPINKTLQYKITILNEIIKYYIRRYNINKSKANEYKASNKLNYLESNSLIDITLSTFYKELYLTKILFNFNEGFLYIRNVNDFGIYKYSDTNFSQRISCFIGHDIDLKQYKLIIRKIFHLNNPNYNDSYKLFNLTYLEDDLISYDELAANIVAKFIKQKDNIILDLFKETYYNGYTDISRLFEDYEKYMFLYSHEDIKKGQFIKELLYTDIFSKFTQHYQYIRLYYGDGSTLKSSEHRLYENIIDSEILVFRADKEEILSQYNGIYKMAKFLTIEELPDSFNDLSKFINKLKDICQHGETSINIKFTPQFNYYCDTRLLLNTNHEEIIDKLLYNKDEAILKRFVISHKIKPVTENGRYYTQLFGALSRNKLFCKEYAKWIYAKKDTYEFTFNIADEDELIKLNNISKEVILSEEEDKYNFLKCINEYNTIKVYLSKEDINNSRYVYRIAVKDVYKEFCKYLSENNIKPIKQPLFIKKYVNKYTKQRKNYYENINIRKTTLIYYVEELVKLREEDKTINDITNNKIDLSDYI